MTSRSIKHQLGIIGLVLLAAIIAGYGYFRARDLIHGVTISVSGVYDGEGVHDAYLPISGNARNAVHLTLDGRDIQIDQNGDFHEDIVLLPGYNVLTLDARDKFGKETSKVFRVILLE